ncbi:subclass B1 metallo-beta-lactamase ANA-1 [Anaeromyxobacter sp. Fw109-5]|uniref:subclass B1 metallo-beta-lactamase ANA-1 n=1 Tax=Anaeromyxobacter sp. (strain Fw109-5) TaxID=404589 RepID=UPI0002EF4F25|nr:subclass B1 metallo-beta-lactamase ANA-1 [Anaeromyxobacter sp. Fw109-5]
MRTLLARVVVLLLVPWSAARGEPETDLGDRVRARPLSAHAWLIRSVSALEGFGDVESNAVLVTGATESVLVDTPATDEQTAPVLAWAEKTLRRPVRHLIVTHWHADRMGGIGAARARQVATYAFGRTRALARQKGLVVPEHELGPAERLTLAGLSLATWYPGHGHTADNIVVWLPEDGVLVAGCFVKDAAAGTLGNVREADPVQWATGVAALRRRYPGARIVVPGHGAAGGSELLARTTALLEAHGSRGVPASGR